MSNQKNNSLARATRKKLITAAGHVFAERGYAHSSLREITDRAGASVAAVNYHFKGKIGLYKAVVEEMAVILLNLQAPKECLVGTPDNQLRAAVRHVLGWLMSHEHPDWSFQLWLRETSSASPRIRPVIERAIIPFIDQLTSLVQAAAKVPISPLLASIITTSIIGQCIHFMNEAPVAHLLYRHWPAPGGGPDVDTLSDYIVQTVLDARLDPKSRRAKRIEAPDH